MKLTPVREPVQLRSSVSDLLKIWP